MLELLFFSFYAAGGLAGYFILLLIRHEKAAWLEAMFRIAGVWLDK